MPEPIPTYNALDNAQLTQALQAIDEALAAPAPAPDEDLPVPGQFDLPPFPDLIGIDQSVYRQVRGALLAGKRHLMFYGPPGTGKTSIARLVASYLHPQPKLITGSADWSSQDIIGGYQPTSAGGLRFVRGVLLENFDRPLVIDELNRCDIDKVIGPLFTVLAGQATTLPYQTNPDDTASPRHIVLAEPKVNPEQHEIAPTAHWRILATINSIDKTSLYQMSYALTRRFGWILVDVPADIEGFVRAFTTSRGLGVPPAGDTPIPLARIWRAVNQVRRMGPAPFIDMVRMCSQLSPGFNFFQVPTEEARVVYVDALGTFLFPMLDGILRDEATKLAIEMTTAIGVQDGDPLGELVAVRLRDLSL